ncbi:uncharacterized protein LOC124976059 isoform X2 [Sciurus carolinensis]|uniref:uncharacterized protein LOC124976059 isoform X2 n=1 Tax=Sciurus carolinensis TaxID=30640 RepID=UPI001FB42E57|nr:uncharacterized protein LOC124976059 isoform X2 [Sciurus carolinensis]
MPVGPPGSALPLSPACPLGLRFLTRRKGMVTKGPWDSVGCPQCGLSPGRLVCWPGSPVAPWEPGRPQGLSQSDSGPGLGRTRLGPQPPASLPGLCRGGRPAEAPQVAQAQAQRVVTAAGPPSPSWSPKARHSAKRTYRCAQGWFLPCHRAHRSQCSVTSRASALLPPRWLRPARPQVQAEPPAPGGPSGFAGGPPSRPAPPRALLQGRLPGPEDLPCQHGTELLAQASPVHPSTTLVFTAIVVIVTVVTVPSTDEEEPEVRMGQDLSWGHIGRKLVERAQEDLKKKEGEPALPNSRFYCRLPGV